MPRKAEFIFPPKRCEWPILSSLIIYEAFFFRGALNTVFLFHYYSKACIYPLTFHFAIGHLASMAGQKHERRFICACMVQRASS